MSKTPTAKNQDTIWSPMVKIVAIFCAIVLIATIALAIVARNGVFRRNTTVMEVGEHKVSLLEFEYYFNTLYSTYASYYGLTSVDIKSVNCYFSDYSDMTWYDYFMMETKTQVAEIYLLADEAEAKGFEITEESKKEFEDSLKTLKENAATAGMDVDEYLSSYYCKNLTEKEFIEYNNRSLLASDFQTDYLEKLEISADRIQEYYGEHEKEYQSVDYYSFALLEVNGVSVESRKEQIEKLSSLDEFLTVLKEVRVSDIEDTTSDSESTTSTDSASTETSSGADDDQQTSDEGTEADTGTENDAAASEAPKELDVADYLTEGETYLADDETSEWLFNKDTALGSIKVFKSTSSVSGTNIDTYTAVYLVSRERNDAEVATMRHFLVQAEEQKDADGNVVTDEEGNSVLLMDKAREEIAKIEDEFVKALPENADVAAKEQAFKDLFKNNETDDTGSQSTGGLYEDFEQGYMTEEIDEWFFPEDPATRPQEGEYKVIETEFGCHFVLALGYSNKVDHDIETALKDEDFNKLLDELKAKTNIVYKENNLAKVG